MPFFFLKSKSEQSSDQCIALTTEEDIPFLGAGLWLPLLCFWGDGPSFPTGCEGIWRDTMEKPLAQGLARSRPLARGVPLL